jgi:predicted nuclease of predicted toxin-antitoxin system
VAAWSMDRLPIYLDECVNHRIVPYLRQHGFAVTTARDEGMLGATDEDQLHFAATRSLVLLSYNRRHFVQLHEAFRRQGRPTRVLL